MVVSQVDPRIGLEVEIQVICTVYGERQRRRRIREGCKWWQSSGRMGRKR